MTIPVRLVAHPTGVAEIIIDRAERHNAMTLPMYEEMLRLIEQCTKEPTTGCILFRGTGGKAFISGTDISYFTDFTSGKHGLDYEAFVERVIDAVERIALPTIAVIDGWAVGGGLALATACDFRVCSDTSRFGAPIAKTLSNTLSSRNIARLEAAHALAARLMGLSSVTQHAVKESLRRLGVEQRLDDDDLIEAVYGSQAFRDGVAAFTSGGKK